MKKFEYTFTNEWKGAIYGFDFIKFGFFGDTDWADDTEYLSFDITLLGFNFNFTWNSDNSIEDSLDLQEWFNQIEREEMGERMKKFTASLIEEPKKEDKKEVKKTASSKKNAVKVAKKVKKVAAKKRKTTK